MKSLLFKEFRLESEECILGIVDCDIYEAVAFLSSSAAF
jgi:hypothetical protein